MQKAKFDKTIFFIEKITSENRNGLEQLTIYFDTNTSWEEVRDFFDPQSGSFNKLYLNRLEIYQIAEDNETLEGVHFNFNKIVSIQGLTGGLSVTLEKENELETKLNEQQKMIDNILKSMEQG